MSASSHTCQLPRRDQLAIDRTKLANQRTLLAYVRTGIYFIATAFGLVYLGSKQHFSWVHGVLVLIGIACMVAGAIVYARTQRGIQQAAMTETPLPQQ